MNVKKIFMTLIVVVACVMIGALVLNVLLPNAATTLVDSVEGMIFNATGMSFDFNGNGSGGSANKSGTYSGNEKDDTGTNDKTAGDQVEGF